MKIRRSIHILIPLICFGFLAVTQAVVPPPDGGYPGFTTAEGTNALKNLTSGSANTGVGWYSLFTNSTASNNTGVGAATLVLNNADENTATGTGALFLNTSGNGNTATGAFALIFNDTGVANTAAGDRALFSNTEGNFNTATGFFALHDNTGGTGNTANGASALLHNTTGGLNTAIGGNALLSNTEGTDNTATGANALSSNTEGSHNSAFGSGALASSTGSGNTAVGDSGLLGNTTGNQNTAIGFQAMSGNNGSNCIAIGASAGSNYTGTTTNGITCIAAAGDTDNLTHDDRTYIGNIRGVLCGNLDGIPVLVDSDNQLGTNNSSRRFKKDIKPMEQTSQAIMALKPVTFHFKNQDTKKAGDRLQFGLIAEDVAAINPDLVVSDKDNQPLSVRYDVVNVMLLNEFLKEHRTVQEQGTAIAQQQKEIDSLKQELKEQKALIEQVNARANGAVPQVIVGKL